LWPWWPSNSGRADPNKRPAVRRGGPKELAFGPAPVAEPAVAIRPKVAITPLAAPGPRLPGRLEALTHVALEAVYQWQGRPQ